MGLTEIPSQAIESAESFMESKLEVATALTKIFYATSKKEVTEENLLKTYLNFYQGLKGIVPPPLEKVSLSKMKLYLLGGVILGFICLVAYKLLITFLSKHFFA